MPMIRATLDDREGTTIFLNTNNIISISPVNNGSLVQTLGIDTRGQSQSYYVRETPEQISLVINNVERLLADGTLPADRV